MSGHLNKQDIQLVLDAWQKEMQAVSEQIDKLFRIFNYHGGALPDSIDFLQEGYTRLLADHIGFDFEILLDWWLTHDYGERPLEIGWEGEELRSIGSNRELAEWIVEFRDKEKLHEVIKKQERQRYIDRIYGVMCKAERPNNRSDMAEELYDAGLRFVEE